MNHSILAQENIAFQGGGGVSARNRSAGFRPAFRNIETGYVYPSRFADGRPAPVHVIDGLPDELVATRSVTGRITSVKESVQCGFVFDGCFFDRNEAAAYLRTQIERDSAGPLR